MPESNKLDRRLARDFSRETGISVRIVPGSESAQQRLYQEQSLLESGSSDIDVFQIDTIWPSTVGRYMSDLRDVLRGELSDEVPQMIENATVEGRLIAAPFYVDYGLLYYRTDFLKRYGFSHPPRTWDELESQAARIQRGERLRGNSGFWGFVWQGADYEGLACDALEWQASQGGGQPLEQNHTVDVNNPAAIRAFSRARGWIGTISPPGVVAYLEEDARNVWQGGGAAFMRNWSYAYPLAEQSPEVRNRFSVAPMPAGANHHSSVLGGWYLGISRRARHQAEAIAFVKYMVSKQVQRQRAIEGAFLPTLNSLYRDKGVLKADPFLASLANVTDRVIRRPASLLGAEYAPASQIYAHGVHMILTGTISSRDETLQMQKALVHLTGFAERLSVPLSRPVEKKR